MRTRRRMPWKASAATLLTGTLAACGGGGGTDLNKLPAGVTEVSAATYPATAKGSGATADTQDLLTGGLGKSGLMAAAPAYADPLNPTAAELRRNALHSNYRGIVDYTANGGFGRFYGPNIAPGTTTDSGTEGLVPGKEYVAYVDDGSGRQRSVIAVQVPDSFDPAAPCIVLGPSSGSRGVYGAIGTAGEWGLKRGCAVALAEGGRGMGLYDPNDDTVNKIDGTRATKAAAGTLAHFAAELSDTVRTAFNAAFPNRLALKHAHSQQNPEKRWGSDTLAAGHYALYVLNQLYAPTSWDGKTKEVRFKPKNTLVIAASVSNGGTSVLQAAEQDDDDLIDGVVAGEPGAQPGTASGWSVQQGGTAVAASGKPLYDYFTYGNLYQPCAALAPAAALSELTLYNWIGVAGMTARATNRCTALAARGLVSGATTAEQATDALAKLRAYGWGAEQDTVHNSYYGAGNAAIITMMYANAYGRFSVADNVCGLSVAQVNATGDVIAPLAASKAPSFATGNGTANGSPASVVYNDSVGGAKSWSFGVSPVSGTADLSLDSALCLRALSTGTDAVTGAALTATSVPTLAQYQAVQAGIKEVLLNGNLQRKPTVLVAGRSDALLPINHTSRAYAAFNHAVEGDRGNLRYIEVTNGQHFDAFIASFSGYDTRFVPLHVYFNAALDAMWAHLKTGAALPASQVVRTTPRGGTPGAAPALAASNVPAIAATPAAADAIGFSGSALNVPN